MKKAFAIILSGLVAVSALAQSTPDQKGLEIAMKADLADRGFENTEVKLRMVLRNRQGQESERFMENKTLELTEDGDKSLIIFNSPKDVEGTATLLLLTRQVRMTSGCIFRR